MMAEVKRFWKDERGLEAIEWVGIGITLLALAVVAYIWLGNAIQGLAAQIVGLF